MLEWWNLCFWMTLNTPIGVEWPFMPVDTGDSANTPVLS